MLYNESTGKPKGDAYSLESVIAWLETQPDNTPYNWNCTKGGCLIGLYAAATGIAFFDCHNALFDSGELYFACEEPRTFGAALDRARKVLAARP